MTLAQWTFFLASVAVLAWVSRRPLADPHCHGFYRFFALAATLGLVALNVPYWTVDRTAPRQLLSWTLLAVSLFLVIDGVRLLRRRGRPDPARNDPTLLGFERTRYLVTDGPYSRIRHPMYASVILLAWGVFLKAPSPEGAALAGAATVFMLLTARVEERECLAYFGDPYRRYMARTRRFLPHLY